MKRFTDAMKTLSYIFIVNKIGRCHEKNVTGKRSGIKTKGDNLTCHVHTGKPVTKPPATEPVTKAPVWSWNLFQNLLPRNLLQSLYKKSPSTPEHGESVMLVPPKTITMSKIGHRCRRKHFCSCGDERLVRNT